jgi:hypothetical protein
MDVATEEEHAATISREVTLKMEAAGSPETQISIYKTTWHHILEANSLNILVFKANRHIGSFRNLILKYVLLEVLLVYNT